MKKFVPITLGKARNLRYSFKALSRLEEELDSSIASIDFSDVSVKTMVTFIWAGLVHEDDNLTVEDVMDLIDESEMPMDELMEKVTQAMDAAMKSMGAPKKKPPARKSANRKK
jgi:hypothetical protein